MDIAGLQAEPVHRRQAADRIAALAVPHQFRLRRGARGEIEQHRVFGAWSARPASKLRRTSAASSNGSQPSCLDGAPTTSGRAVAARPANFAT